MPDVCKGWSLALIALSQYLRPPTEFAAVSRVIDSMKDISREGIPVMVASVKVAILKEVFDCNR